MRIQSVRAGWFCGRVCIGIEHAGDALDTDERANGVVDKDEFGVVRNQFQRGGYGFLLGIAAF